MTITNGVAEYTLGVTGKDTGHTRGCRYVSSGGRSDCNCHDLLTTATPGLNPHAQAEPAWLPVWTVDGDEAAWVAKGRDDDGRWELWCEPERDELWVYLHGLTCQCVTLTEDQARALHHSLAEWIKAREVTR